MTRSPTLTIGERNCRDMPATNSPAARPAPAAMRPVRMPHHSGTRVVLVSLDCSTMDCSVPAESAMLVPLGDQRTQVSELREFVNVFVDVFVDFEHRSAEEFAFYRNPTIEA
ncbi:unannotated protein [freshwater metagenome]|uniref:Unannotated protein n=1 Tax=freshwater metagenome TaxID=449393 RepID=A0A6J6Z123_9ZZZZ